MSVLDEIRKLDEQKAKLLNQAKKEALQKAEAAIRELNELGFDYRLVEGGGKATTGARRTGIRNEVLSAVKAAPHGVKRADILAALDANDKSSQQSVSNALSALKKAGSVTQDNAGNYKAT